MHAVLYRSGPAETSASHRIFTLLYIYQQVQAVPKQKGKGSTIYLSANLTLELMIVFGVGNLRVCPTYFEFEHMHSNLNQKKIGVWMRKL